MTKHGFIFLKIFALLVFLLCSIAHSWECERKNVRTYLGKKDINVCIIHYDDEREKLEQMFGDFIRKISLSPEYYVEVITDKDLIHEAIEKEPYPDPYINEVNVERVTINYDKNWKIVTIRYQSQLYDPNGQYGSPWWDGISFRFDKKQKVVRTHRYGRSAAFFYCTEYSKYKGKTGNWNSLDCGQIK